MQHVQCNDGIKLKLVDYIPPPNIVIFDIHGFGVSQFYRLFIQSIRKIFCSQVQSLFFHFLVLILYII